MIKLRIAIMLYTLTHLYNSNGNAKDVALNIYSSLCTEEL